MIRNLRHVFLGVSLVVVALVALGLAAGRASAADQYPNDSWFVQYWENVDLAGPPHATRYGQNIDFNWGLGYPEALDGQNTFSVRWTRAAYFPAGVYRFVATMDDGMRVWIDGLPIIDAWGASAEHTVSKDVPLAEGWHNIRVDYQERGGMAVARFNWSPVSGGNTYPNWKAEYFNNPLLSGAPVVVRDDRYLDFTWGFGAPDLRLSADNFSARWTRTFNGVPGQYRLDLTSDDGARLYINGQLLIDNWGVQPAQTRSADYWFSGPAQLRVEYFELEGVASVRLDIVPVSGGEGLLPPTPTPTPPPPTLPDGTVSCPVVPTATNGVVISARPLNVRAGAGLEFAIIAQLQSCAQPLLTGNRSADGQWVEVLSDSGAIGWVLSQYLLTIDDSSSGVG
ncbi:MAG: hypothetical protein IPH95_16725 [Candidatus Promineofilum sp.]|jgi:hypothetical protein|nr:hypothetical protein [Promineifilum sp.]